LKTPGNSTHPDASFKDAGEITDKGYVNQRAVLERRHTLVEQLYTDDTGVILIDADLDPA